MTASQERWKFTLGEFNSTLKCVVAQSLGHRDAMVTATIYPEYDSKLVLLNKHQFDVTNFEYLRHQIAEFHKKESTD